MPPSDVALPLFLPANRLDRPDKAVAAGADAVILDLDDAVEPGSKAAARQNVADTLKSARDMPILIRFNPGDTPDFEADPDCCTGLLMAGVMQARAGDPAICARGRKVLPRAGHPASGDGARRLHRRCWTGARAASAGARALRRCDAVKLARERIDPPVILYARQILKRTESTS